MRFFSLETKLLKQEINVPGKLCFYDQPERGSQQTADKESIIHLKNYFDRKTFIIKRANAILMRYIGDVLKYAIHLF